MIINSSANGIARTAYLVFADRLVAKVSSIETIVFLFFVHLVIISYQRCIRRKLHCRRLSIDARGVFTSKK